ncbi:MAG: hypothetical protein MUE55_05940 [Thermoplasmata archaeon]|nr:hypothetical protein [Thermoplasmata archaeon]
MKTDVKSKLSASLIVLVMAISALAVLPGSFAGADAGTNTIFVPVVSGGTPVTTGVTVTLTNVHTGEVITAPYSSTYGVYMATGAPSGFYRVDVVADGYYDEFAAEEFRFDGLSTYTVDSVILTEFAPMIYTWNVTVRDVTTNQKIVGADVMFYDPVMDEVVASEKTDSTGVASVEICSSPVLGDLDLVVKADTYRYHIEPVAVTGDNLTGDPVLLTKSVRVTGFVADYDSPASNVVAYLLSHDVRHDRWRLHALCGRGRRDLVHREHNRRFERHLLQPRGRRRARQPDPEDRGGLPGLRGGLQLVRPVSGHGLVIRRRPPGPRVRGHGQPEAADRPRDGQR